MKDIFCTKQQKVTPHTGTVDANGEFVFRCAGEIDGDDCGAFVKYPADTTPEKLDELIEVEAEANEGQVSLEGQEDTLKLMLGESNSEEEKDEEEYEG